MGEPIEGYLIYQRAAIGDPTRIYTCKIDPDRFGTVQTGESKKLYERITIAYFPLNADQWVMSIEQLEKLFPCPQR